MNFEQMKKDPVLKVALHMMTVTKLQDQLEKAVQTMPTLAPVKNHGLSASKIAQEKSEWLAAMHLNLFGRVYCEIAGEVGFDKADELIKEWVDFMKQLNDSADAAEALKS
ncbi:MAG: hypothetical protein WA154_08335 [Moraxellaceae bacterium]